jgi:hypothetical protein
MITAMKRENVKARYRALMAKNPKLRKIIGVGAVVTGIVSLVTPLTPGSWLIFIGLEILGVRFLFWGRIKEYVKRKGDSEHSEL